MLLNTPSNILQFVHKMIHICVSIIYLVYPFKHVDFIPIIIIICTQIILFSKKKASPIKVDRRGS